MLANEATPWQSKAAQGRDSRAPYLAPSRGELCRIPSLGAVRTMASTFGASTPSPTLREREPSMTFWKSCAGAP